MPTFRTEAALKAACRKYARSKGVMVIPQNTIGAFGTSGIPDDLYLFTGRRSCFIEFKMPGQEMTELQKQRAAELVNVGQTVRLLTSFEDFKIVIDSYLSVRRRFKKNLPGTP